ncbi:MAG: carbohydrate-binding family 9-like protein, partial [Chitinivibrionia bacterium]|nr:carbohydrate-binding family 9-like protein [Chitinivibrionia bacterium]
MRRKILILVASISFACLLAAEEKPTNLMKNGDFAIGSDGWTLQIDKQPNDGVLKVEDGALLLSRQKDDYFMRAYQDVETTPSAVYKLDFRIKVEGSGTGRSWVILQGKDGKWVENKIIYSEPAQPGDWRTMSLTVPTFPDTAKTRINFGVNGKNISSRVKDIRLTQVWEGRPLLTIPVVDNPVVIDGKLDDPAWSKALVLDDFRVLGEPGRKAIPGTKVQLLIAKGKLYIGYTATEPRPESIRSKTERDTLGVYSDDCVETFISPDASLTFFHFIVNPLGFKGVEQKGTSGQNQVWYSKAQEFFAGEWSAAAHVDKDSWTSELCVDLKDLDLKVDGANPVIYTNFCRHRPSEEPVYSNWAGLMGATFHAPTYFLPLRIAEGAVAKKVEQTDPEKLSFTKQLSFPGLLVSGKPVRLESG